MVVKADNKILKNRNGGLSSPAMVPGTQSWREILGPAGKADAPAIHEFTLTETEQILFGLSVAVEQRASQRLPADGCGLHPERQRHGPILPAAHRRARAAMVSIAKDARIGAASTLDSALPLD